MIKISKDIGASRLKWAEDTLFKILHGEKPSIDTNNKDQAWLYEQMIRMHKDGLLSEEPKSYVFLPNEDPADEELLRYKGVTAREPLPKALTSQARAVRFFLEEKGIRNTKALGEDYAFLYMRDPLDQLDYADSFVLSKAGLSGLYQWVRYMRASADPAIDMKDKTFVMHNADGFWDPSIDALDLKHVHKSEGEKIKKKHIRPFSVADSRHDAATVLRKALGDRADIKARWEENVHKIDAGSTMFVVTGNPKKVQDYKKAFGARNTGVNVKSYQGIFSQKPEGADELSYTYVGNNLEKFRNFIAMLRDTYGPEAFRQEMEDRGYDIDTAYLLFDDGGVETDENLIDGEEFKSVMSVRSNPYKDYGPGPETKHLVNAVQNMPFEGARGRRGFMKRMESALKRKEEALQAEEGEIAKLSRGVKDKICTVVVPLKDLVEAVETGASVDQIMEEAPYYMYFSVTEGKIIFEPRPNVPAVDEKNFTIPVHDPDGRTQAEIPGYVANHSMTAQAVKVISRTMGIQKQEGSLKKTFNFNSNNGERLRIGTQYSLHKDVQGHGLWGKISMLSKYFNFMSGADNEGFDLSNHRPHKMETEDGLEVQMKSALNNFFEFCLRSDGFFLTNDNKKIKTQDYFWDKMFMMMSLIVGHQINDKTVTEKPFLVMEGKTWDPYHRLVEALSGGLIPELPHQLYKRVAEKDDVEDVMKNSFAEYDPHQVPTYKFREGGAEAPEDMFRVTVYCSATTTDFPLKMWARNLSFDMAGMGFAVVNGGGTGPDGLMVETSNGVHKVRDEFVPFLQGKNVGIPQTHVSSIHCEDTAQEEGLCDFNDYWAVYPWIYQRMQALQETDAEVVLPGGAGTIQEIAASILMRKAGVHPSKDRPMIIVNKNGVYDPLVKMIPQKDYSRYNIHVVETNSEVMDILLDARKARGMDQNLPYSYEEFKDLKDEYQTGQKAPQQKRKRQNKP